MTLSSPRSKTQFFDAIKWSYPKPFTLVQQGDVSRTENGRALQTMSGQGYWRFSATVQENVHSIATRYQALIEAVAHGGLQFYAYDFRRRFPASDPKGQILGSNIVKIDGVGGNNTSVSLKGLPDNYDLTIGDYMQITSVAGVSLHRILNDVSSNGSGVTPNFEIIPELPTGVAVNDVVDLKEPCTLFIITPGSITDGSVDLITTSGLTVEFEEA